MIKVETKFGKTDMTLTGSFLEICADTIEIISCLKKSIKQKLGEDFVDKFKRAIAESLQED